MQGELEKKVGAIELQVDNFNVGLEEIALKTDGQVASVRDDTVRLDGQVASLETRVQRLETSEAQGKEDQGEAASPEAPAVPAAGAEPAGLAPEQPPSQQATGTRAGPGRERPAPPSPAESANLIDLSDFFGELAASTHMIVREDVQSLVEGVKSGALPPTHAALSRILYARVLQRRSGLTKGQVLKALRLLLGNGMPCLQNARTVRAAATHWPKIQP